MRPVSFPTGITFVTAALLAALFCAARPARAQTGQTLAFDGADDGVILGETLPLGGSYTMEAWVYYTGGAQNRTIISSEQNYFWLQAGVLKAGHNGSQTSVADSTALPANTWTHVAVTYDGDISQLKLYRNGRLVAQNNSAPIYTGGSMGLGARFTEAEPSGATFWAGRMDEIRVWNIARSQGQILEAMNAELESPASEEGLVACYQCNQGEAGGDNSDISALTDSLGSVDGQLLNFGLIGGNSNFIAPGFTPPAAPANGLAFDGVNDFVLTPLDADADEFPEATWEAWVYPTVSDGTARAILSIEDGGADRAVLLVNGQFRVNLGNSQFWDAAPVSLNQWQHIAVVYAADETRFYKNGEVFTDVAAAHDGGTTTLTLALGAHPSGTQPFAGRMDEVRVWNYARTVEEIETDFPGPLTGYESGLMAYYNFNQGTGGGNNSGLAILVDQGAYTANHGVLNGFALTGTNSNWVTPGFQASLEIDLRGNGLSIPSGSLTPSLANGTDFGALAVNRPLSRSFVITNTGNLGLRVNSISVSGAHATDFDVSDLAPPVTIAANGSDAFSLRFTPSATGQRSALVTIASADADESSYTYAVRGTGMVFSATAFVTGEVYSGGDNGIFEVSGGGNFDGVPPIADPGFSFGQFAWSADLKKMYLPVYSGAKVVSIAPDGTVTDFATGLSAPTGLLLTRDGRLLVAEETSGEVTDITAGGDFTGAAAFATGLSTVRSLLQGTNGTIYAAEFGSAQVSDITAGGAIGAGQVVAGGFAGSPTDMVFHPATGRILVAAYFGSAVQQITGPGTVATFATGQNFIGLAVTATGRVLAQCAGSRDIYDITAGGDFSDAEPFAYGFGNLDMALDTVPPPLPVPRIAVRGNGNLITNGSLTVSAENHTDFSNIALPGSLLRTFVITNSGNAALAVSGIGVTGANAEEFVVGGLSLPANIAASNAATFTVFFTPGALGARDATLSITNSDTAAGLYTFALRGAGVNPPPPALAVRRSGANAVISWPVSAQTETLEVMTNVASGVFQWGTSGFTPATIGTNYEATIPLSLTNQFFRLRRP